MRGHEISATGFDLNMAGWVSEKGEMVVHDVAKAIDELRAPSVVSLRDTASILWRLHGALNGGTKLWAFGAGAEWTVDDPGIVWHGGMRGFVQLKRHYYPGWEPSDPLPPWLPEEIRDSMKGKP
jgi:hypothetical protein